MRTRHFLLVLFVGLLWGQSERGNITGLVTDSTGGVIAGAAVAITNMATNTAVNVSTTSAGEYNVPNLSPGSYRVEIGASGFKRFAQSNVVLSAAGTVRLDAQLIVGQVSETVEVQAAVAQIQTETAKVGTSMQNRMVDDLPLVVGGALRSV